MAEKRVTWVSIVALLVLLSSCGSSGGGDAAGTDPTTAAAAGAGRIAVVEDLLEGPGSTVADDVEVQEGSRLVGSAFPFVPYDEMAEGYASEPSGWEAVFVVDGDPLAVWQRYAQAVGIGDRATAERSCVIGVTGTREDPDWRPDRLRLATEARLAEEDHVTCSANVDGVRMGLSFGVWSCPDGYEEVPACPRWGTAHLHIRVDGSGETDGYEDFGADEERYNTASVGADEESEVGDTAPLPGGPLVEPSLDFAGTRRLLPAEGERIDAGLDPFLGTEEFVAPVSILPDGARSLISPGMPIACNSGLAAVVEVPGTPAEAVGAFDADRSDDPAPTRTGESTDGEPWAQRNFESAGGYYVDLTAVPSTGGSSLVLFTECGD